MNSPIPFRLRQPHSKYVDEGAAEYIEHLESELELARAVVEAARVDGIISFGFTGECSEDDIERLRESIAKYDNHMKGEVK